VATLNALEHDFGVVRIAPEVFDGFFPGAFTAFSEWARKNMKPGG
jgi:hypothetical protein